MYYLIHTPNQPRPYLSTVSFIANDFASWGCRVTRHANDSAYITEVRYQEKRHRPGHRRIELMEVWAKEVLARKAEQRTQQPQIHPPSTDSPSSSLSSSRKARASAFAQDFISSLSVFESPLVAPKPLQNDPLPLPSYPLALVARYTRLLHRCAYTSSATLPSWADPAVFVADQIALEFRFDRGLQREQLAEALRAAIAKGASGDAGAGRMGKVERCDETGLTKVLMWADVGDLVARECGKEEVVDPVPLYERGAWEWPPSYEACEGAVVG
ncbi:hypothetical protein E8E13_007994 [Curvularia kusanoi]|uniref:Uncharacterized protein n=1 Tax=Curvularia kusanoi TaxID=90978 RepID=A0A9P4WCN1_CURKU|nr:hypothetical protein E8E13_007994 [Curvularia kusanoi]